MKAEEHIYPYTLSDFSNHNAIVLAPHPDDESIGCGGSIVKHTRAGSRVRVIFLTKGGRGDFEGRFGEDYLNIRLDCARKALGILGVKEYEFWEYKDRELVSAEKEIAGKLFQVVKDFSPSIIYAPSPFEIHPDHRAAFSFAWNLIRNMPLHLLLYETLVPLFPDTLVNITDEWQYKKRAVESYRTELYYNNYSGKVEGLNRYRTATLSKEVLYAEAFLSADAGVLSKDTLQSKLLHSAISFHSFDALQH
jgi:LmbE family N-acetylglucosaminyl deacetylase